MLPRPSPTAGPVLRRGYLIVVPRPMPAAPLVFFQVLGRAAQVSAVAAAQSQQKKDNSTDVQMKRTNFTRV